MNGWPTTRRHPRSMAEAFPRDHAPAITHYRRRLADLAWVVVCIASCIAIGVLIAITGVPT